MSKSLIFVCVCFFLSFSFSAVYTWTECVEQTLAGNRDLQSAREGINQSIFGQVSAKSALYPQADFTASARTGKSGESYSGQLSISQLIWDGGKTESALDKTAMSVQSDEASYKVQSALVRYNLRKAFLNCYKYQQLVSLYSQIEASREKQLELIKLRYTSGREHKGALLTAEANLTSARADLAGAKRTQAVVQHQILQLMGQPTGEVTVSGDLKLVELQQPDFEPLLKVHPTLQQLRIALQVNEKSVIGARASEGPNVRGSLSYGLSDTQLTFPRTDSWSAGLSLAYPLWDWGAARADTQIAESQLQQARIALASAEDNARLTLEQGWIDYWNARDQLQVSVVSLKASEVRTDIADMQYNTGQMTVDNWLSIHNELISNQRTLLTTQVNVMLAEAAINQAKGGGLDEEK